MNEATLEISFRFYYLPFHRREPELFLVAEYQDTVIGFILVKNGENFGESPTGLIYAIGVLPEYQSQGIGTRLVNSICNILKDKGCKKLFLHVRVGNKEGIKFYQRLGFFEISRIKEFYSWGEDSFRMVKHFD